MITQTHSSFLCKPFFFLFQQEVFEARYMNIPQKPEGCSVSLQCAESRESNKVGSPSTSESSLSNNSSESEKSSDEVAMQLAHLEEKVGITQAQLQYIFA